MPIHDEKKKTGNEAVQICPSISVRLIRHAESKNNEVYRTARHIYRGGTPDFDEAGWTEYVNERRKADPGLSKRGKAQARVLSEFLVPHLNNQASHPVRFIVSPMKRALETLLPTLEGLKKLEKEEESKHDGTDHSPKSELIVNAFYHESEGCHIKDKAEDGLNRHEIGDFMKTGTSESTTHYEGFDGDNGWYANRTGGETRANSQARASKFYLWLCDYLDNQLYETTKTHEVEKKKSPGLEEKLSFNEDDDVFDAGVSVPGEENEVEHDKFSPRVRRRRTAILVGHGDFMSLVLKRIITGFGHTVEKEGITNRSAFVHFNTGITELEYFGAGRFLLMSANQTPHLVDARIGGFMEDIDGEGYQNLKTGGSLKDGWSYIIPAIDEFRDDQVAIAFVDDDDMEKHVKEQTKAMKSLYLSTSSLTSGSEVIEDRRKKLLRRQSSLQVTLGEEYGGQKNDSKNEKVEDAKGDTKPSPFDRKGDSDDFSVSFVVKRGMEVVGCATLNVKTGYVSDFVVRPSARNGNVGTKLIESMKKHAAKFGCDRLFIDDNDAGFFARLGFKSLS